MMRYIPTILLLCILLTWSIAFGIMLAPIDEWRYIQRPGRSYEIVVTPQGPMLVNIISGDVFLYHSASECFRYVPVDRPWAEAGREDQPECPTPE